MKNRNSAKTKETRAFMWGRKSKKEEKENIDNQENYESAFGQVEQGYDQGVEQNVEQGYNQNVDQGYDQNFSQGYDQNGGEYYEQAGAQSFDESQSSYTQSDAQPLDATQISQPNMDPNAIVFVPGQDGVPSNITPQGIENLVRLERLRRNGVIDDTTYINIFNKICNQFLS